MFRYLLFIVLITSSLLADSFNLLIKDPPSMPYKNLPYYDTKLETPLNTRDSDHFVVMTQHHIIPDSLLVKFFNNIISNNDIGICRNFYLSISNNIDKYKDLNLSGQEKKSSRDILLGLYNGKIKHSSDAPALDHYDILIGVMINLPGNLFVGPDSSWRSDDSDDSFEVNANVILKRSSYRFFRKLNDKLLDYSERGLGNQELAQSICRDLSRLSKKRTVYEVSPDNWIYAHSIQQFRLVNEARINLLDNLWMFFNN